MVVAVPSKVPSGTTIGATIVGSVTIADVGTSAAAAMASIGTTPTTT